LFEKWGKMAYILGLLGCALLVFLDQFTKHLATVNFASNAERLHSATSEFIPGFLSFTHHTNDGAAWGILSGARWFFVTFTAVVLVGAVFIYVKLPQPLSKGKLAVVTRICMVVFIAGALGNMVDRAINGEVVDFLKFEFINFPIFNLADVFLVASVIPLSVIILFFYNTPKDKKIKNAEN